jgi:ribosome maturation factor RimP
MTRTTNDLPTAPSAAPPRFDADRVRALVEPLVAARGFGLWDIEWTGSVLRVFIEHPAQLDDPLAGVTLDDCVHVSRALSAVLDEVDLIPGAYSLEVSSPGLDRPLRTANDFKRQLGRLAKCKLKEPASDGQMALRGTILSASAEAIAMEVDGKHFDVRLDNIREAKLVFELGHEAGAAKSGKSKKKGAKPAKKQTNGPRPPRK